MRGPVRALIPPPPPPSAFLSRSLSLRLTHPKGQARLLASSCASSPSFPRALHSPQTRSDSSTVPTLCFFLPFIFPLRLINARCLWEHAAGYDEKERCDDDVGTTVLLRPRECLAPKRTISNFSFQLFRLRKNIIINVEKLSWVYKVKKHVASHGQFFKHTISRNICILFTSKTIVINLDWV